jgi:hypothetical protein
MHRALSGFARVSCAAALWMMVGWTPPAVAAAQAADGVYRLPKDQVDQLLALDKLPGLRVLVIDQNVPTKFSEAHSQSVRTWLERGGVVWVEGKGVESQLVAQVAPFDVRDYEYQKSGKGGTGGELVVRGGSPNLVIGDHPLTNGVQQLYVFARRSFDGTRNALPILEMTDSKGHHGLVIAALPIGQGLLVLDGTSRQQRRVLHRIPDFSEKHPNAVKQGKTWNSYDWAHLMENARRVSVANNAW